MTSRKAAYFIALTLTVLITGPLQATEPTTKFPAQDIAGLPFNDTALSKDDEDFVAMVMRHKGTLDGRPYQELPVYLQQLYMAAHFLPNNTKYAQPLLYRAYVHYADMSWLQQQYWWFWLAQSYELQGNTERAELAYRQAMHLGMPEACVNLGSMLEKQQQLEQARTQYEYCIPELAHATLYLNLGSLYYNNRVQKQQSIIKNKLRAGEYWQQSYLLDSFDADIHYNLGVYHLNTSKDFAKARFHFAVCANRDRECVRTLGIKELKGLASEPQHLKQLLDAQGGKRFDLLYRRSQRLASHPLPIDEPKRSMQFSFIEQGDDIIGVKVIASGDGLQNAGYLLNQWVYVDSYGAVNTSTQARLKEPFKAQQWQVLGQSHQLTGLSNSGDWQYEIRFSGK